MTARVSILGFGRHVGVRIVAVLEQQIVKHLAVVDIFDRRPVNGEIVPVSRNPDVRSPDAGGNDID